MSSPHDVGVDSAGNVYIADYGNSVVRKVANGTITTVAGNGERGFSGDGGAATSARFESPYSLGVDPSGVLYIADWFNFRIRRVANGIVTTIAGDGTLGYRGDEGPAAGAWLGYTEKIAVDSSGAVYFADGSSNRVRVLIPESGACRYSVTMSALSVPASGGTFSISVQAPRNCSWSIAGLPSWLTVSGAAEGTGPGTVLLIAGSSEGTRSGLLSVGGVSIPLRQLDQSVCGGSTACVTRALPHVMSGGDWALALSAISSGSASAGFAASFYDDNGAALSLPFGAGLGNLSRLADSVPAEGRQDYESPEPAGSIKSGWALVSADPSLSVAATLRRAPSGGALFETAVPATAAYSRFIVPFDATTFEPTGARRAAGFAVANLNPEQPAGIACSARDNTGAAVAEGGAIRLTLNPNGHYVAYQLPSLAGRRGSIECTADTLVAAAALAFVGSDPISAIPVFVPE